MSQNVESIFLQYKCHLCDSESFVDARRLRDHYLVVEGCQYPNTKSKTYNTKFKKFISATQARARSNVKNAFACVSCSCYFIKMEDLSQHLQIKHEPKKRPEVESSFSNLIGRKKWTLSNGTVVEDKVFEFGKKCVSDHASQSLILDVNDLNIYVENEIFTVEEVEEIKKYNIAEPERLPNDFKQYLNKFNCQTNSELRSALNERQEWEHPFDRSKSFNLDWIKHTIYTLSREYEDGTMEHSHKEQWYNVHIWGLIDRCFGDLEGVEVVRGETCSVASSLRKNNKRNIKDMEEGIRKEMGYRCDLLIRQSGPENEPNIEYCASEVGIKNNPLEKKRIRENFLKLPKLLKDMLDVIIVQRNVESTKDVYTYGIINSGLSLQVLRAERIGYITRITRNKILSLSPSVSNFGETVLPIIVQIYLLKLHVGNLNSLLNFTPITDQNNEDWLDTCLEERDNGIIIPQTSLST